VPTAGPDPGHPADAALAERLAAALAPEPGAEEGDARRALWLLHYIAGTFLRRCLVK